MSRKEKKGTYVRVLRAGILQHLPGTVELPTSGGDIIELLRQLEQCYGPVLREVLDNNGNVRPGVAILVNGTHIASLQGLRTKLRGGDSVLVCGIIAGG